MNSVPIDWLEKLRDSAKEFGFTEHYIVLDMIVRMWQSRFFEIPETDDTQVEVIMHGGDVKGSAIPVEWARNWAMKNWVKSKKCEYDIIVSKMIDDWREENG